MKRRSFLQSLGLTLAASDAFAQPASGRVVRMIVPLAAGSSNDHVARVIAPYMSNSLGQTFVVENKAGGNSIIGTMEVVRAAPDGQTLLLGSNSPLAVNVALVKNMPYDPRRDLTPIAGIAQTHWVLMVKPTFPARTLSEFIQYAKQKSDGVTVGSSTTAVQVQIATLSKVAGIRLLPISYKGTPGTITDVLGGVLDSTLLGVGDAMNLSKSSQMRALAVSSLTRNAMVPDWPAISETFPGFDFRAWNALVGPAHMAPELVNRLNEAVNHALKQKELVERYAGGGSTTLILTPEELKAFIDSETTKWIRLAREANVQPE